VAFVSARYGENDQPSVGTPLDLRRDRTLGARERATHWQESHRRMRDHRTRLTLVIGAGCTIPDKLMHAP
jgi:hypothetical protein